jgi:hypothetical protein
VAAPLLLLPLEAARAVKGVAAVAADLRGGALRRRDEQLWRRAAMAVVSEAVWMSEPWLCEARVAPACGLAEASNP